MKSQPETDNRQQTAVGRQQTDRHTLLFHPSCTKLKSTGSPFSTINSPCNASSALPVSHGTSLVSCTSGRAISLRPGRASNTGLKLCSAVYMVRRSGDAVTSSTRAWCGKLSQSWRHCSWPSSVSSGSGMTWLAVERLCTPCGGCSVNVRCLTAHIEQPFFSVRLILPVRVGRDERLVASWLAGLS